MADTAPIYVCEYWPGVKRWIVCRQQAPYNTLERVREWYQATADEQQRTNTFWTTGWPELAELFNQMMAGVDRPRADLLASHTHLSDHVAANRARLQPLFQ